ncbi:MAG: SDR family oxidoreductase [Actinobacteria bacterium]|nr:SDR family oxidoreductase [Actinomycetota bacterium]
MAGAVALVTGGASGIGRATVRRLCEDGAAVVAGDINAAAGAVLLEELTDAGFGQQVAVTGLDVAAEGSVAAAVAATVERFGRLDCLVNNAGIGGAFGPLTEIEVEDWDHTLGVLLRGPFLGLKHAVRVMRAQGTGGSVVNVASVAGWSGGDGPQAYSAAKAGVINLTRSAAVELAPHRIRVNAVCPGPILTPLVHRGREDAMRDRLARLQPWPEHGRPEHVADAIAFLASGEAAFVTGQALAVDGGLSAAGPNTAAAIETNAGGIGLVGVNHGTTGRASLVRRRVEEDRP